MSSSDFQARTNGNNVLATFMKQHPSFEDSHRSSAEETSSVPRLIYKSQHFREILEPAPFREGASLELLPHSDNMFVTTGSKSVESYISSAIACIVGDGSCHPSENVEQNTSFSDGVSSINDEDTILALPPSMPVNIRDTMPMGVASYSENMSTSRDQKLDAKSQVGQWEERFQQLLQFKARHGHCLVPHAYPENPSFARWSKRQRFQYKLLRNHKPSVMTEERVRRLESVGFVWDPQTMAWEARLLELREFKMVHGHCNVPCRYYPNPALGAWVKRQRRMYKKYMSGAPTNVSPDRFRILADMGFQWEIVTFERNNDEIEESSEMGS